MVTRDAGMSTEVLVVGGGPGGYVAAIRAAKLGHEVTLVEAETVGGTCLTRGCIPSKALVSATDVAHRAGAAERIGVHADLTVDLAEMVSWKDRLVRRLTGGVESLLERAGVTVIEGRATLESPDRARISSQNERGKTESVNFEYAILATGSRPTKLPEVPFDGERVISSRDALALETVPTSLAVVGAGYIGLELATVYAKLGAEITVLEQRSDALPAYEDDITEVVRGRAEDLGISFRFGRRITDVRSDDEGVTVATDDGEIRAEKCLVAVGRNPVTEGVGLTDIGVETDDHGFVVTDQQQRAGYDHIFAVGDVAGEPMLAHAAFREGEIAAEVIDGQSTAVDTAVVPAAVFTDPEIGTVGLTSAEAEAEGFEPIVGEMPLRASGRALTLNDQEGFVRVVADADEGILLGAQIVGPEASELIAEVALGIELGATVEDLATTVHVHPTLSEAVHEAAMGTHDSQIHY